MYISKTRSSTSYVPSWFPVGVEAYCPSADMRDELNEVTVLDNMPYVAEVGAMFERGDKKDVAATRYSPLCL